LLFEFDRKGNLLSLRTSSSGWPYGKETQWNLISPERTLPTDSFAEQHQQLKETESTPVLELDQVHRNRHQAMGHLTDARSHLKRRDYAKADSLVSRALELAPDYYYAYHVRADLHAYRGSLDAAIADYTKSMQLEPDFPGNYYDRAKVYAHRKQFEKAIADVTAALETNASLAKAFNVRGQLYLMSGHTKQAQLDLSRAKSLAGAAGDPTTGVPPDMQVVITKLNRLGATLRRDTHPKRWLVGVDFTGKPVQDVDLIQLSERTPIFSGVGYLRSVVALNLDDTSITDQGLSLLKNMTQLKALRLRGTKVTDSGLVHLAKLSRLEFLSLDNTTITDAGLVHVARMTTLKTLWLDKTQISDAGLVHLRALRHLEYLGFNETRISDEGLTHLRGLPKISNLEISQTLVTDQGLANLKALTNLSSLWLHGNAITDAGLVHINRLTKLKLVTLDGTKITDRGLLHLRRLTRLERLSLRDTHVTDAGVAELKKALPNCKIRSPGSEPNVPGGMEVTNSIGMKLRLIPAGEFTMGSPDRRVTLTKPFYLGVTEVTQEQYQKVMGKNPSQFQGPQNPVETVSWAEAVEFCGKLSAMPAEKTAGHVYRLPTEAEWEYACRSGTTTAYGFGDDASRLGDYGWFRNNSSKTHPVGEKKPNAWGLYDMHGNVWEWCQDRHGNYPSGSATNPTGATSGSLRVIRGGGWNSIARSCRSAFRFRLTPGLRDDYLGFRVLRSSIK
jgi:formylglycine-generating enzyme required for sulfatase activity/tetratricopeptide (TPR) repeat protein